MSRVFVERRVVEALVSGINGPSCQIVQGHCAVHRFDEMHLPLGRLCPVEVLKRHLVVGDALPANAEELLAAIEADQADINRLKAAMDGLEERVATAMRRADDALARMDRVARAAS